MKTYIITEQALQALKDIIEAGTSEILEPSTGESRLIVLRMMEKGLEIVDLVKNKTEITLQDAINNNHSQAIDFIPKGDVVNSKRDCINDKMAKEFGHERFQFES